MARVCTEIHTLSHQVTTNTPLFPLKTLHDSFQRPSRSLCDLRHSPQLIVHKGSHIMLQTLLELFDDGLRFTIGDGGLESNIGLDDIYNLVRQVILTRTRPATHVHTRTDVQRGDQQDLYQ